MENVKFENVYHYKMYFSIYYIMKFFRLPWNKTALCNSQHCTKLHNEVHNVLHSSIYWKIGLFCVLVLLNTRKKNLHPQLSIQALSREIRDSTNLVNTNHFLLHFSLHVLLYFLLHYLLHWVFVHFSWNFFAFLLEVLSPSIVRSVIY